MTNWNISARASQLHTDSIVWDNHCCMSNLIAGTKEWGQIYFPRHSRK